MSHPPYPPYPPYPPKPPTPPSMYPPPHIGLTPYPPYPEHAQMPVPDHYPPPPPGHHHPPPPGHHHPPPPGHHPPPPHYPPYYATVMIPVPVPNPPPSEPQNTSQPTYVTNYIYHDHTGSNPLPPPPPEVPVDAVQVVDPVVVDQVMPRPADFNWVPSTNTTAQHLIAGAVVGGHEGWDGSPLYVIRAHHEGDLVPGKLSLRHNLASIPHGGKEIQIQNIEVLCGRPSNLRWVPASDGAVPPGAIPGGTTSSGEQLYVGRGRYQMSLTPGKVHPSHGTCYISFAGGEVSCKSYDVLCHQTVLR